MSSKPLAEIVNLSFKTWVYIEILKISRTIPIFKNKGSEQLCSNYRTISLYKQTYRKNDVL